MVKPHDLLVPIDELLEDCHKRHMDALWEDDTETAKNAYKEYLQLLKEQEEGVIYVPKF